MTDEEALKSIIEDGINYDFYIKNMMSNELRINFYLCYERSCRKCVDGSCTDKEKYKSCEFSADNVAERERKRAMERRESDRCGNCLWFDGEDGEDTRFCDIKQREVSENGYCYCHKSREKNEG